MAYFQLHNGLGCEGKDLDCERWRQKVIALESQLRAADELAKYVLQEHGTNQSKKPCPLCRAMKIYEKARGGK